MVGFIVHNKGDRVGVAVRVLTRGEEAEGWCMEDDSTMSIRATTDVPLGHKIALGDCAAGDAIIKYGVSIGLATADIGTGDHVHTHNLRSARWQQ